MVVFKGGFFALISKKRAGNVNSNRAFNATIRFKQIINQDIFTFHTRSDVYEDEI